MNSRLLLYINIAPSNSGFLIDFSPEWWFLVILVSTVVYFRSICCIALAKDATLTKGRLS